MKMSKTVILTGLRANNDLHLGNYLGALLPMVELQKKLAGKYQINLFVPDLHSFTTPVDHSKLYEQSLNNIKLFVASGLDIADPDTYIYRQSFIPAHSEMTVILNCFTHFGELGRMIQFKDKSSNKENVSAGLFDYPVLMAADILLYGAKYVPVGEDQTQHVELARDIAIRINNKFGEGLLQPPEAEKDQIAFSGQNNRLRIRDLVNPDKKMSKTSDSDKGVIFLTDNPDSAVKKVLNATTDSLGEINYDYTKQPGVSNLQDILSALSNQTIETVKNKYAGQKQYKDLKESTAEVVKKFLTDFQTKLSKVDEKTILEKLSVSEKAMNNVANEALLKVQKAVGLRQA